MPDKMIPALAPHIHVLAAITGMTFDLFHLIVEGRLGFLLPRCVAPGSGPRHYWPPDQTWGACSRRGSCSGRRGDFTPPGGRRGRGSSLPFCGASWGRRPRSLPSPGRAARRSRCRGRELLSAPRDGCSPRLLSGLRGCVFSSTNRLTRPLASGMARIDIQCRAKKNYNKKKSLIYVSRTLTGLSDGGSR